MPQPDDTPDVEPDDRGTRPPWWRRALAATLRSLARAIPGLRGRVDRNQPGTYRSLGSEYRGNRRAGQSIGQAVRAT